MLEHHVEIDFNAKDICGWTAFMTACVKGNTDIVQLMLQAEIDFNAKDDRGRTAFVLACEAGSKNVVELILKYSRAKGFEIPTNLYWVHKEIIDLLVNHYKTNELKK